MIRMVICLMLFLLSKENGVSQVDNIPADFVYLYDYVTQYHPDIKSSELQLECAISERQSARGVFDINLISDLSYSFDQNGLFNQDPRTDIIGSNLNAHNLSVSSGVSRRFRSGLDASVSLGYRRSTNNFPINAFNENIGPFIADNTTSVNVSLSYALLRNQGKDIITAGEGLADLNIAAQSSNLRTTVSQSVFSMTLAYWEYLLASESYKAFKANEVRVSQLLDKTKQLVEAERRPESDLIQIEADLQDKLRQTYFAAQQKVASKINLGRASGLDTDQSDGITDPLSRFPEALDVTEVPNLERYLALARVHRPDLQVLREILKQFEINKSLAENNTKPQLDLRAFSSYSGFQNGNGLTNFLSALAQSQGRNYQTGLGLSYSFPVQNNFAKGAELKASFQLEDQQVRLDNTVRNIELNISIAHSNLLNSIETVEKAKSALDYYKEVYDNEQIRFQSGLTTLLNVIIFQERLTFAELDYLRAQFQQASAIAELRFRTGINTLLEGRSDTITDLFYTLPR